MSRTNKKPHRCSKKTKGRPHVGCGCCFAYGRTKRPIIQDRHKTKSKLKKDPDHDH